jgi:hypothetical protein
MKGVLTRKQRVFNYRLSRTRMTALLDLSSVHVDMDRGKKLGYYCLSVVHFT